MLTEFEPSNLIKKTNKTPNQTKIAPKPKTPFPPTNKKWITDPFTREVHSLPKGFAVKKKEICKD